MKTCPNCGQNVEDSATTCSNCNYSFAGTFSTVSGDTYFDGKGLEYFGIWIVNVLLIMVTCGIAMPWVICRNLKWKYSHTILNGRRLMFTGTGGQLFLKYLLWALLTTITFGIYGIWMAIELEKWEIAHVCYADALGAPNQEFANSFYDGKPFERFGYSLLCGLIAAVSFGIAFPWGEKFLLDYDLKHTVVMGNRLGYTGTGGGLFGIYILVYLLNYVTCSIFTPWGTCMINNYVIGHYVITDPAASYTS
ncbi:MAG: DUF898 family protein [Lachnospiraceae bacterium]|nr:DUF898 family protein [Lachnospiraceae bacterium]